MSSIRHDEDDEETKALLKRLEGYVDIIPSEEEQERQDAGKTAEELHAELKSLQEEKEAATSKLSANMEYLNTTPVGLEGPLIDANGYPRNDCDLYAVRAARHAVNCSRNDLMRLQETMMRKLNCLHSATREKGMAQMERDKEVLARHHREAEERRRLESEMRRVIKLAPLATVSDVKAGSPAFEGGLRAGQQILEYGAVNILTITSSGSGDGGRPGEAVLRAVMEVTAAAAREATGISIWVRNRGPVNASSAASSGEGGEVTQLFVVPMTWAGQGLLGCGFDVCKA